MRGFVSRVTAFGERNMYSEAISGCVTSGGRINWGT